MIQYPGVPWGLGYSTGVLDWGTRHNLAGHAATSADDVRVASGTRCRVVATCQILSLHLHHIKAVGTCRVDLLPGHAETARRAGEPLIRVDVDVLQRAGRARHAAVNRAGCEVGQGLGGTEASSY